MNCYFCNKYIQTIHVCNGMSYHFYNKINIEWIKFYNLDISIRRDANTNLCHMFLKNNTIKFLFIKSLADPSLVDKLYIIKVFK